MISTAAIVARVRELVTLPAAVTDAIIEARVPISRFAVDETTWGAAAIHGLALYTWHLLIRDGIITDATGQGAGGTSAGAVVNVRDASMSVGFGASAVASPAANASLADAGLALTTPGQHFLALRSQIAAIVMPVVG